VICTKAMNGIPAVDKVRREFRAAADADLRGESGPAARAIAAVGAGGSCRFLRVVQHGTETRVIVRIAHADGSMPEYVVFVLAAGADGAAVAIDIDVESDGGSASARLRRFFLALAVFASPNVEGKLRGDDRLRAQHLSALDEAEESFRAGQNRLALERLATVPSAILDAPDVVLLRLNVSRAVSDEAFRTALADVRRRDGRGPAAELIAVDHFLLARAYDDAHAALANAKSAIGGDPYLDWIDATIFDAAGDLDGARVACQRAIEGDAMLEDPWWTLLSLCVRQDRHDETAALLGHMAARFEIDWKEFEAAPAYARFFDSAAGRMW
jgi:hypothetical protein